jgi:O-antigen/teichoic acid export membrane protein
MGWKAFISDISASFLLKLVNAALLFLIAVLLARWLGPAAFGHYAFAVSVVTLALVPVSLGMPALLVREVAKGAGLGEWGYVRGAIRLAWWAVCGMSLVIGVALALTFQAIDSMDSARRAALMLALLLIPLTGLNQIRQAILQGFRCIVAGQVPELLVLPVALLLALLLMADCLAPTAEAAIALRVGATALALLVGLTLLRVQRPVQLTSQRPEFRMWEWSRALVPFSLLAGLGAAKGQLDIFLLGLLAPADQLGVYKVATAVAGLIVLSQTAFNVALAPRFAALHAAADRSQLEQLARMSARWVMVITLPAATVLILAGQPLLSLVFGPDYAAAATPLAILCLGQVVNGAVGSVALILTMTGFETQALRISALMLVVSTAMLLVLVPLMGINGAALASAISIALLNLLLLQQVRRHIGINPAVLGRAHRHA